MQNNGYILTSFELELLFERLDKNHDGKVTFNEVNIF
jgi:Ca2+-binding EF-hand superfamily protein